MTEAGFTCYRCKQLWTGTECGCRATILHGDWLEMLAQLPAQSVHCCVTSPPYWGLRDYGVEGQLGLEKTPEEYVENVVAGFSEVRRVLRDDGTIWLNLGDSYNAAGRNGHGTRVGYKQETNRASAAKVDACRPSCDTLKEKDLIGIPWRVAFALQADGWYLRQDIIWSKPNPMPESVTDRCTKSHEYIFLLSKSARYYYDAEAVQEDGSPNTHSRGKAGLGKDDAVIAYKTDAIGSGNRNNGDFQRYMGDRPIGTPRNKRSVWTVAPQPYRGAHFATFPPKLILPCILAGCPDGGLVLDPFHGAGTTGMVAQQNGRRYIGIELNEEYIQMSLPRIRQELLPI